MKKLLSIIAISVQVTMFAQTAPKKDTVTPARLEKGVQCTATTKAGARCKKMTKNVNHFCQFHQPKQTN